MDANKVLSLKKVTLENIDSKIEKIQDNIKFNLDEAFTSVAAAEDLASDFAKLVAYKDARLLMQTASYKMYEKTKKELSYEDFMQLYHNDL